MLNNKSLLLNLILFVSFVALISAFFIEYALGHQPCNLCILERIPYVFAIVIILLNYKFSQFEKLFLEVSCRAALSAFFLVGKKDKIAADKSAVDSMRNELN